MPADPFAIVLHSARPARVQQLKVIDRNINRWNDWLSRGSYEASSVALLRRRRNDPRNQCTARYYRPSIWGMPMIEIPGCEIGCLLGWGMNGLTNSGKGVTIFRGSFFTTEQFQLDENGRLSPHHSWCSLIFRYLVKYYSFIIYEYKNFFKIKFLILKWIMIDSYTFTINKHYLSIIPCTVITWWSLTEEQVQGISTNWFT